MPKGAVSPASSRLIHTLLENTAQHLLQALMGVSSALAMTSWLRSNLCLGGHRFIRIDLQSMAQADDAQRNQTLVLRICCLSLQWHSKMNDSTSAN